MQNDPQLKKKLAAWPVTTPLAPNFQSQVWRRIERTHSAARASLWSQLQAWLDGLTVRPAFAVAFVSALLVLGVAGGAWQASRRSAATGETLRARYVQSVDPYQLALNR